MRNLYPPFYIPVRVCLQNMHGIGRKKNENFFPEMDGHTIKEQTVKECSDSYPIVFASEKRFSYFS
jgi:hypothetical protein